MVAWGELSCELPIVLIKYYKYSKKIWKTNYEEIDHAKWALFEWKNDCFDVSATVVGGSDKPRSFLDLEEYRFYYLF